ncbi:serine hydrolase domain-containing protein [Bowmanella yangjiangensis]|uniref:Serine hydrolase n=1 Tax=Bowmanella yangjiangensis TaxID=2811230 RepID=A0ABS3CZB0_9ALTE|nr:serine hydrolase [Bowmanella yangjiangensis]MBN7822455.1 serine hydrolase [Bowmanella yangjiangensis]
MSIRKYNPKQGARIGLSLGLMLGLSGGAAAELAVDSCPPERLQAVARYFSVTTAEAPQHYQSAYRQFPARAIGAAPDPLPLARGKPLGEVEFRYADSARRLDDFLQDTRTHAFLVLHKGQIRREQYFNGGTAETRFLANSLTKSLVGLLVGVALEQGLIASLDEPVSLYLPELAGSAYDSASVRQVLDMTTAVRFAGQDPKAAGRGRDIEAAAGRSFACGQSLRPHPASALPSEDARHGERFSYVNTNPQVLGALLERVAGMSLSQFMERNLWSRIGTEDMAYWLVDQPAVDNAMEHAWMGFNARLRDYARVGQLLLQEGEWQGQALIAKDWLEASEKPTEGFLQRLPERPQFGYSHQWWIPFGGAGELMGIGFGGQYLYVNRPSQLVVVQLSANPAYDPQQTSEQALAAFRAIADQLEQE